MRGLKIRFFLFFLAILFTVGCNSTQSIALEEEQEVKTQQKKQTKKEEPNKAEVSDLKEEAKVLKKDEPLIVHNTNIPTVEEEDLAAQESDLAAQASPKAATSEEQPQIAQVKEEPQIAQAKEESEVVEEIKKPEEIIEQESDKDSKKFKKEEPLKEPVAQNLSNKEFKPYMQSLGVLKIEVLENGIRFMVKDLIQKDFLLENPYRIVIDFEPVRYFESRSVSIDSPIVSQIAVASHDDYNRAVVYISEKREYQISKNQNDWFLEIK